MSARPEIGRNRVGDEEARLRTLHDADLLDTLPEDNFDEIVANAATRLKVPMALFSLVAGDRIWFKARVGTDATQVGLECAFCAYAARQDEILIVEDASKDPRFAQNRLVQSGPRVRFYAGIPVHASNGHVLGTLCVMDTKARTISEAELGILECLARSIETQIELRQTLINQSRIVEERAILTDMIMHDASGLVASLRWSLSSIEKSLPDNLDAVKHCRSATDELLRLCDSVLTANDIQPRGVDIENKPERLKTWLESFCLRMARAARDKNISVELENGLSDEPVETDIGLLERIAMNLVNNSIQACPPGSRIRIRGNYGNDNSLLLDVSDDGPGVPAEIEDRLFEPYVSFRRSGERGTGLGLTICRLSARALGGSVHFCERERGAKFVLEVPRIEPS